MTTPAPFTFPAGALEGKVAVVTGASKGLGAGMAARFVELGMSVGVCSRTRPALTEGPGIVARRVDVSDARAVQVFAHEVQSALGPIDLWINNAGVLDPMGPHRDHDPAQVAQALAVNIGGVANGTRSYCNLEPLDSGHRRVLVNISSGAAQSTYSGWSVYGATKAAVDHFTRIVAIEEPSMICHSVAPGVVDTEMQEQIRTHDRSTFPAIDRFHDLYETSSWNSPGWVADHLLAIVAGTYVPDDVVVRIPDET